MRFSSYPELVSQTQNRTDWKVTESTKLNPQSSLHHEGVEKFVRILGTYAAHQFRLYNGLRVTVLVVSQKQYFVLPLM